MSKKLLVTALLASTAIGMSARSLTPAEALQRVRNDQSLPMKARTMTVASEVAPALTVNAENSNDPMLYVFTNADKNGFMVVSADDVAKPLLGYSDNGTFSVNNVPENVQWWLNEYAAQISAAARTPVYAPYGWFKAPKEDHAPIAPMLTTRWNQSAPYNNRCPEINGTRSVTGCLATAEAQVMNYHKWPEKVTGSVSYTWQNGGKVLEADMDTIPLVWDKMLDDYTESNPGTAEEQLAVANLMLACGVASQMNYSPSSSGATSLAGARGFYANFGCTQSGLVLREWYSPDEWDEYIYNYIAVHGPLVYCGQGPGGGHAFVCDGYRSEGYYHFNWGWGGTSDGYYVLDALNPATQGIGGTAFGYNTSQQVIPGLHKPGDVKDYIPSFAADGGLTVYVSRAGDDENLWDSGLVNDTLIVYSAEPDGGGFWNFSMGEVPISFGLHISNDDTGENFFYGSFDVENYPLGSFRGWKGYLMTLPQDIAEGMYNVRPAMNAFNTGWRDMPVDQNYPTFVMMEIRNDSVFFSKPKPADFEISDLEFHTPLVSGGKFTMTASARAIGARSFYGNVRLLLGEMIGEDDFIADYIGSAQLISAEPDEDIPFSYNDIFATTSLKGKYTAVFINAETGKIVSEPIEVTIAPYPKTTTVTATNIAVKDQDNINPVDFGMSFDLNCTAGYFSNELIMIVGFNNHLGGYSEVARYTSKTQYLLAGESAKVEMGGFLPISKSSDIYDAYLKYYDSYAKKYVDVAGPITFSVKQAGLTDVTVPEGVAANYNSATQQVNVASASEDIATVEVFNATGNTVTSVVANGTDATVDMSAFPAGVYLVRTTLSNGATLTTRFVK